MRGAHAAIVCVPLIAALRSPVPAALRSDQPLEFAVSAPATATMGRPVPITLRLRNVSSHPVEARFLGRTIVFDIIVTNENTAIVWRRLGDRSDAVPGILQLRTLAPGERMEWHATWEPKAPGRYRVQGVLPSDDPEPRRTRWAAIEVR